MSRVQFRFVRIQKGEGENRMQLRRECRFVVAERCGAARMEILKWKKIYGLNVYLPCCCTPPHRLPLAQNG